MQGVVLGPQPVIRGDQTLNNLIGTDNSNLYMKSRGKWWMVAHQ
jgi:hypothetical protein